MSEIELAQEGGKADGGLATIPAPLVPGTPTAEQGSIGTRKPQELATLDTTMSPYKRFDVNKTENTQVNQATQEGKTKVSVGSEVTSPQETALRLQVQSLNKRIEELGIQVSDLIAKLQEATQNIAQAEIKAEIKVEGELANLRTLSQKFEEEIRALQKTIGQKDETIADLLAKITRLRSELEQADALNFTHPNKLFSEEMSKSVPLVENTLSSEKERVYLKQTEELKKLLTFLLAKMGEESPFYSEAKITLDTLINNVENNRLNLSDSGPRNSSRETSSETDITLDNTPQTPPSLQVINPLVEKSSGAGGEVTETNKTPISQNVTLPAEPAMTEATANATTPNDKLTAGVEEDTQLLEPVAIDPSILPSTDIPAIKPPLEQSETQPENFVSLEEVRNLLQAIGDNVPPVSLFARPFGLGGGANEQKSILSLTEKLKTALTTGPSGDISLWLDAALLQKYEKIKTADIYLSTGNFNGEVADREVLSGAIKDCLIFLDPQHNVPSDENKLRRILSDSTLTELFEVAQKRYSECCIHQAVTDESGGQFMAKALVSSEGANSSALVDDTKLAVYTNFMNKLMKK